MEIQPNISITAIIPIALLLALFSCSNGHLKQQAIDPAWDIDTSLIDISRSELNYDSVNQSHLEIYLNWAPKNDSPSFEFLFVKSLNLDISDVSKVELTKDIIIPSDHFKLKTYYYGPFSNREEYKNVTGKIRFEELTKEKCAFLIMLEGELSEMVSFPKDTFICENIVIPHHES